MAVQLTNCVLGVRNRPAVTLDVHKMPVPGAEGALRGPWPGRKKEAQDRSWTLALDPGAWPVAEHDVVEEPASGSRWTVVVADLVTNVADPLVDYVRVEARVQVSGSTQPSIPETRA